MALFCGRVHSLSTTFAIRASGSECAGAITSGGARTILATSLVALLVTCTNAISLGICERRHCSRRRLAPRFLVIGWVCNCLHEVAMAVCIFECAYLVDFSQFDTSCTAIGPVAIDRRSYTINMVSFRTDIIRVSVGVVRTFMYESLNLFTIVTIHIHVAEEVDKFAELIRAAVSIGLLPLVGIAIVIASRINICICARAAFWSFVLITHVLQNMDNRV
mmetsp:Transcript_105/g.131  ORF Transcript_105/g.131 Transcript_105/m.131 type:complete len:219 (+) Transcript_105:925-1581(+)